MNTLPISIYYINYYLLPFYLLLFKFPDESGIQRKFENVLQIHYTTNGKHGSSITLPTNAINNFVCIITLYDEYNLPFSHEISYPTPSPRKLKGRIHEVLPTLSSSPVLGPNSVPVNAKLSHYLNVQCQCIVLYWFIHYAYNMCEHYMQIYNMYMQYSDVLQYLWLRLCIV